MAVRPLTTEEKQRLETDRGLLVESVDEPAASAGVLPGDIVLGVSGKPVENVRQLRDAVRNARESVALLIRRGNAQIFVAVPVGRD